MPKAFKICAQEQTQAYCDLNLEEKISWFPTRLKEAHYLAAAFLSAMTNSMLVLIAWRRSNQQGKINVIA